MKINTGINADARKAIAEDLAKLLADTYVLYIKTHNFHWNVKGPMFNTLHSMFEGQYMELAQAVDEIAERIRALDFPAPGSYKRFTELTCIKEESGVPKANEMIAQLVEGHEIIARNARKMMPKAQEANDDASVDLFTKRIETHEKTAWMLRSSLED